MTIRVQMVDMWRRSWLLSTSTKLQLCSLNSLNYCLLLANFFSVAVVLNCPANETRNRGNLTISIRLTTCKMLDNDYFCYISCCTQSAPVRVQCTYSLIVWFPPIKRCFRSGGKIHQLEVRILQENSDMKSQVVRSTCSVSSLSLSNLTSSVAAVCMYRVS